MRIDPAIRPCRPFALGFLVTLATASCARPPRAVAPHAPVATETVATIFLIGDAGGAHEGDEPVLDALRDEASSLDHTPIILFLGDNIYPRGMPAPDDAEREEAERRLTAQIDVAVASNARAIFIPGNHDWDFGGESGRQRLLQAALFGESTGEGHAEFLPASSCPGPHTIDIGQTVRIVLIDTQWWLFREGSVAMPAVCAAQTMTEVLDSLKSAIATAGERKVVVAGHHPLASGGTHGGHFTFRQHLFPLTERFSWAWIPLPGLGSAYPVARRIGVSDQDLTGPRYRAMRVALETAFRENPPLVYASGHEHTLQVIRDVGARYQVVSGTGNYGHSSRVTYLENTLFASPRAGYVRLDFQRDGRVRLGAIIIAADGDRREAYSAYLE
jgi:hypothetical protein